MYTFVHLSVTLLFAGLHSSNGARILAIFPTPLFSHQRTLQVITKALAARGHHMTVISPNPLETPIENYTDIDLSFSYDLWKASIDYKTIHQIGPAQYLYMFWKVMNKVMDAQFSSPQLQSFIRNGDHKFDLVLKQKFLFSSYYGLIHHVGSPPVVSILSLGGLPSTYNAFGNPDNPSYSPHVLLAHSDHMTFWQRMQNMISTIQLYYLWNFEIFPVQEAMMRKYFGSAPPSVYESEYNNSLMLLCNHWSLNYPRPLLPNIVELTGLHLQNETKPLPKDIKRFLDGAKHGAIYFSLGSNLKSNTLPEQTLKHITAAFSELPQRVLWKWETDFLPGQPKNVMVEKWLPQQDILAHPNVRVFITQGGLQSLQEAAYHGVPLVAIPFIADQKHNVEKIVTSKIGVRIDFSDLTQDVLLEAIGKILNDSSYREKMKSFSAMYREQVEPSLDRAIWWIEYVLRHNGARHLRSAALDLTWYQYLLLDVVAAILFAIIVLAIIGYVVVKKIAILFVKYSRHSKLKLY